MPADWNLLGPPLVALLELRLAAGNTAIPEYNLEATIDPDHLRALLEQNGRFAKLFLQGVDEAESHEDPATADITFKHSAKPNWMFGCSKTTSTLKAQYA